MSICFVQSQTWWKALVALIFFWLSADSLCCSGQFDHHVLVSHDLSNDLVSKGIVLIMLLLL